MGHLECKWTIARAVTSIFLKEEGVNYLRGNKPWHIPGVASPNQSELSPKQQQQQQQVRVVRVMTLVDGLQAQAEVVDAFI